MSVFSVKEPTAAEYLENALNRMNKQISAYFEEITYYKEKIEELQNEITRINEQRAEYDTALQRLLSVND